MRGWVLGVAASVKTEDKEPQRRFRVGDVRGQGIMLVRGEGGERWILVDQGRGSGGGDVSKGEVLGVRGPVWDVELGGEPGERWMVGVEWGVVDG